MSFEQSITAKRNFMQVDYTLIKKLGVDRAVFLTHLIKKHDAHNPDDGWFYATYAGIEGKLGLTTRRQQACVKDLRRRKLIKTHMRTSDTGTRQYFFINIGEVKALLDGSDTLTKPVGTPSPKCEGVSDKIGMEALTKPGGSPYPKFEGLPPKNERVNYTLKRESKTIADNDSQNDTSLKADGDKSPATDNPSGVGDAASDAILSVIEKILSDDKVKYKGNTSPIEEIKIPSTEFRDPQTENPSQPTVGEAAAEPRLSDDSFPHDDSFDLEAAIASGVAGHCDEA